jgi:hypothetical protein
MLKFSPDLCPSPLLGFLHRPSSGSGEFLPFKWGRFRRVGSWFAATTVKHLSDLRNLKVDSAFSVLQSLRRRR